MRLTPEHSKRMARCTTPARAANLVKALRSTTRKYHAEPAGVFNKDRCLIVTDAPDDVLLVLAGGHPFVTCPSIKRNQEVHRPSKTFREQTNVGHAKYVVSFYDGVKKHSDGSPFFDVRLFSSKLEKEKFVQSLHSAGYTG